MTLKVAWLFTGIAAVALAVLPAMAAGNAPNAAPSQQPDPLPNAYPPIARAPLGAPNILLVLTDDIGFGVASAFGGPVPTPNLERLAASGLKYNRFHTTAMCSPTRAALLTGRNHHAVGTGSLTDFPMGTPGYTGMIPKSAATIAEVLRDNGYNTAFLGKHHNVPKGPFASAGPFDYMPNNLGFEYFFGFVGSDTDQWRPRLYRNGVQVVDEAAQPPLDQRLGDEAIHWLHQQKGAAPDKPFFLYLAPGSAHTPHQAPAEWIARFKGKFAQGWNKVREETLARQKALGLVPRTVKLPNWPDELPQWDSLPPQEKAFQERTMEVFAAQVAFQDMQLGRILDELERMGQRDNTMIVFVEGDNGPDAAATAAGTLAEGGEISNKRLTPQEHWQMIDKLGGPEVASNYGTGWAQAMATPFPFYKQIASHLGGTRNGMVISWPGKIKERGLRTQYGHVIDIFPTLLTAVGIKAPEEVEGVKQQPVDGTDFSYTFAASKAPDRHRVQYYEMLGNRAIYADGWLASTVPLRRPWEMGHSNDAGINKAPNYVWELYNLDKDFNQTVNLAANNPGKLEDMKKLFDEQAQQFNVNPVNDRTDSQRILGEARAYLTPRNQYVYWGKGIMLDVDVAPSLVARSFAITADLTGGNGVIAAVGSSQGGWCFALEDGRPVIHHALSVMPADQFHLVSSDTIKPGQPAKVMFNFDYDGGGAAKGGLLSILIDGRKVAEKRIERTIINPSPHAENFDIGLDTGIPVIETTKGSGSFTGDLKKLVFDLGPQGRKAR
ncbi:arylsulfatase [Sphingobium sp.]|uniref:arylsulfatase n=1 Tax=Sphingobium sp. TaxID=1912891 RepID=UPI002B95F823|nr:arylsulfatase [Sphingobium sp.]HUD90090.1 arylsulfatase [Sphingobium sp.]